MEFLNNSKNYSLNRKTYINLRWIAIIGQLVAINLASIYFKFEFSFNGSGDLSIKSKIIFWFFERLCCFSIFKFPLSFLI